MSRRIPEPRLPSVPLPGERRKSPSPGRGPLLLQLLVRLVLSLQRSLSRDQEHCVAGAEPDRRFWSGWKVTYLGSIQRGRIRDPNVGAIVLGAALPVDKYPLCTGRYPGVSVAPGAAS